MPAAQETLAAGFVLHRANSLAFHHNRVNGENSRLVRRARAAARDDRVFFGDELGFDKQVAEGRVRDIGSRRCQHDLGITGQFDFTHAWRTIRDRDAAHLGVVFRRNDDVRLRQHARVQALENGTFFRKRHFVTLWRAGCRLITR